MAKKAISAGERTFLITVSLLPEVSGGPDSPAIETGEPLTCCASRHIGRMLRTPARAHWPRRRGSATFRDHGSSPASGGRPTAPALGRMVLVRKLRQLLAQVVRGRDGVAIRKADLVGDPRDRRGGCAQANEVLCRLNSSSRAAQL